jgi:hypothetical protein
MIMITRSNTVSVGARHRQHPQASHIPNPQPTTTGRPPTPAQRLDTTYRQLDPEPAQPFRQLTAAVWRAFPQHPPYGGAYNDVVPHLTVAEQRLADLPTLLAVERAVQSGLPLVAHIEKVLLVAGTQAPNSWRVVNELRLEGHLSNGLKGQW